MTVQHLVSPEKIESELLRIWEELAKENKTRASLFNLIVFNRLSQRTDYIRGIVQKVVEKFPCRTLFISEDPDRAANYLKTAISVVTPMASASAFACDQIDVGVAGASLEIVPFLILPHLIPDLPIYLLWAEDPSVGHPLFSPLSSLATRIICDSESTEDLLSFGKTVLALHAKTGIDLGDLNWARTEGWRDLLASLFDTPQRVEDLKQITSLKITYNAVATESFCHLKIQSLYLLAWLANQLGWTIDGQIFDCALRSGKRKLNISIEPARWEKLGPGTIISVEIQTATHTYAAARIPEQYHRVKIQIASEQACDLPYQFVLGQTARGPSLVKEICTKGTSAHYLQMLENCVAK